MNKAVATLVLLVLAAAASAPAVGRDIDLVPLPGIDGASLTPPAERIRVALASSHATVAAGQAFTVAATVEILGEYWLYGPTPRGIPQPLRVALDAGDWAVGEPQYPRPAWHRTSLGDFTEDNLVYERRLTIYFPVTASADASPGRRELKLTLVGQLCDVGQCYAVDAEAATAVTVGPEPVAAASGTYAPPPASLATAVQWSRVMGAHPDEAVAPPAAEAASEPVAPSEPGMTLWAALGLSLLAGLALNVMPCVLPVIPIKIMSLLQQARESRRRSVTLGMAYAGGIVLFFLVVAAVGVILRETTQRAFDLNEPFKYPAVVIGLALALVAFALWLFDAFTINIGGSFGGGSAKQGHIGSAGMGFLTGILATPCSGPVLAAVFFYAQTQPSWVGAVAMSALGVGMAAPHAVLASFPGLLERLPAPGMWMVRIKQVMGVILLLVAVWLVSALGDTQWMAWVSAFAVVMSLGLWIAGGWVGPATSAFKRRGVRLVAVGAVIAAGAWMLPEPAPPAIDWKPFDAQAIETARAQGRTVLVKFTADWCTYCKILDLRLYNRTSTADGLTGRGVLAMKADLTRTDAPAAAFYEQAGEQALPVTYIYPPHSGPPIRLAGLFSQETLFETLDAVAAGGG